MRNDAAEPCWRRFLKKHGRKFVRDQWLAAWETNKDRVYWDAKARCFRVNAIPTRQSDGDKIGAKGTPCLFDFERGEVPNCVREDAAGELFIAPQLLKELSFDSHGLAAVLSPRAGWMYVNRRGKVVINGVAVMDNGADSFHDGLVRIVRNGKYGFANGRGQVVVPAIYDGAMNFENGRATVCKGCESKCAEPECEHHILAGGEWFRINTKGIVLTRLHPDN